VAGDVALSGAAASLGSGVSSEVVARVGVVLWGVQWLGSWLRLKTRRSVDFDFAETAGLGEFRWLAARF